MQILIIMLCKGCGATLLPISTDTARLHDSHTTNEMDNAINRHRNTAKDCPYHFSITPAGAGEEQSSLVWPARWGTPWQS